MKYLVNTNDVISIHWLLQNQTENKYQSFFIVSANLPWYHLYSRFLHLSNDFTPRISTELLHEVPLPENVPSCLPEPERFFHIEAVCPDYLQQLHCQLPMHPAITNLPGFSDLRLHRPSPRTGISPFLCQATCSSSDRRQADPEH